MTLNISLKYKENKRYRDAITLAGFNIITPILSLIEIIPNNSDINNSEYIHKGDISDFFNYSLDENTYNILKKKPKFIADMVVQMSGKTKNEIIKYLYDNFE